jgi:hypothetical protein
MNCTEARPRLADHAAGLLPEAAAKALAAHLDACPACRAEAESLRGVCRLLSAAPAPEVRVDLPALYREAARRERLRARRWKRAALVAGVASAAALLVALFLKVELSFDRHQLVVRWGTPPGPEAPPLRPADAPPAAGPDLAGLAEHVRRLDELARALAFDAQARDVATDQALARLRAELRQLRQAVLHQWAATDRGMRTVLTTFLKEKGTNP